MLHRWHHMPDLAEPGKEPDFTSSERSKAIAISVRYGCEAYTISIEFVRENYLE